MRRLHDPVEAARLLAGGGVVLLPTDTLPGLHCRADAAPALARLQALKGRDPARPLLLLCADEAQAFALAAPLDAVVTAYARRCWPGPFTLVLPRGPAAPVAVCGAGGTVACRVPAPPALRALVRAAGGPLVSTSANRSGEPPCATLEAAVALLGGQVDAVLAGWLPEAVPPPGPSALIDLAGWPPRLLRPGP
ncbi:MAG: L-threonylcarbamoyladenylate synthase, partial [Candidatus Krumholzibacteriia bacterium]